MTRTAIKLLVAMIVMALLSSCIQPTVTPYPPTLTPTRPSSPISPIVTPVPPTVEPAPIEPQPVALPTGTPQPPRIRHALMINPGFENPFIHEFPDIPEYTTAQGWRPWWSQLPICNPGYGPKCVPGTSSSPIRLCPKNCQTASGGCKDDTGCFWARPEFKQVGKQDVYGIRVYMDDSAQVGFVFGREGNYGQYQRVYVGAGSTVTFSVYVQAWICYDSADCRLGHMNPQRRDELMQAWGCTDFNVCRTWPASDLPAYLRSDLQRAITLTDLLTDSFRITPTMNLQVGIDPTGTFTDGYGSPNFANVVWSEPTDAYDIWARLEVVAIARSDYVTVITRGRPEWPYAYTHNNLQWDAAGVLIQEPANQPKKIYLPVVIRR